MDAPDADLGISPHMLRIRVDLVPGGRLSRSRQIGDLAIWNVSALAEDSEYRWALWLHGDDHDALGNPFEQSPARPLDPGDGDGEVIEAVGSALDHEGEAPWTVGRVRHRRSRPWSELAERVLAEANRTTDGAA